MFMRMKCSHTKPLAGSYFYSNSKALRAYPLEQGYYPQEVLSKLQQQLMVYEIFQQAQVQLNTAKHGYQE